MQPNNQQGLNPSDPNQPPRPLQPVRTLQPLHSIEQLQPAQPQQPAQPAAQPSIAPTTPPIAEPAPNSAPAPELQQAPATGPQAVAADAFTTAPPEDETDEPDAYDDSEPREGPITWTAHEYIHREKGSLWFFLFTVVIIALAAVSVLTQAWSFTALIVVIFVVVIVYSRRPPRDLAYSLTDDGLSIDGELHAFSKFKAFGVIRDGEEYSIMLIPMQRFQPSLSVYFPEEAGEDIVDMLGSRLPMKDLKLDTLDRVVRLLRL